MEIPSREAIAEKDRWDLTKLYSKLEDWQKDYQKLEGKVEEYAKFSGHLGDSAKALSSAMTFHLETYRLLEKVYTYASMLSVTDTANSTYQGYLDQAINLYSRLSAAASFITPELISIDDKKLADFLDASELKEYKRYIREIVRYKPHTLSHSEEKLLATGSEVFGSVGQIFSQLNNADLTFGTVEVDGEKLPLSHSSFIVFLKNPNREIRKRAYEQYYSVFDQHKNTIAATYAGSVKKDIYLARARNYKSAREASLFPDEVNASVYDNLIKTVSENLQPLYHYFDIRRKALNLKALAHYDTHVPLVSDIKTEIPYDEAAELVSESVSILGEEYATTLRQGLSSARWVDRYENKGKRSGAFSGGCYDSPPYILMNYKAESIHDLFTLTHEAGHSMHSYFSRKAQKYQDHEYTIFVAEVASTFNEELLFNHLLKRYKDDKRMCTYLINQKVDDVRSTFYRQVMFAEFEKIAHEKVERNEPLTLEVIRTEYMSLLKKYFGPDVELPEVASLEALRIPHFYSAFYVYKYATGIAAAIALADKVMSGDKIARDRYLNFLHQGGTKSPIELLKDAGVDMNSGDAVKAAALRFAHLVKQLEGLV